MALPKQAITPPLSTNGFPERAVSWKSVSLGLALVLVSTVLAANLLHLVQGGSVLQSGSALIPVVLMTLQLLMLAAVWYFVMRKHAAPFPALGMVRPRGRWALAWPWVALSGSLLFGALYVGAVTAGGAEFLLPPALPLESLGEGPVRWANFTIIGVAAPFAEEVFFRAFMLAAFVNGLGVFRGAVAGSAVFAVSHGDIAILVPTFVSGLFLSWLYLKTRSLGPPFTAHAAQNLLALSVAA